MLQPSADCRLRNRSHDRGIV